jgi:hypothetical protein
MGKPYEHLHGFEVRPDEAKDLKGKLPTGAKLYRHNGKLLVHGLEYPVKFGTRHCMTGRH